MGVGDGLIGGTSGDRVRGHRGRARIDANGHLWLPLHMHKCASAGHLDR